MAVGDDSSQAKAKREPGMMRNIVEKAFHDWTAASGDKKSTFLLKGAALAWAESWMLSRSHESDAAMKRFIQRSIARGAESSARGRAIAEDSDFKLESRTYWAVIAVAAFTVFTMVPSLLKWHVERNGPSAKTQTQTAKAAAVRKLTVDPNGSTFATVPPFGTESGKQSVSASDTARPTADAVGSTMEAVGATVPGAIAMASPREGAPANSRSKPFRQTAEDGPDLSIARTRLLSELANKASARGEANIANQLAIEAILEQRASPKAASDATLAVQSASSLYRTLGSERHLTEVGGVVAASSMLAFCGNTARALMSAGDGRYEVWDIRRAEQVASFHQTGEFSRVIAVKKDCSRLMLEAEDYSASVVPAPAERSAVRLVGHEADLGAAELSNDGQWAITSSFDATARIWDLRDQRNPKVLRGHEDRVVGASFSGNGQFALTWSEDRTARVWETSSGRKVAILEGHKGAIIEAAIAADDRRILTTSSDGVARLWSMPDAKLVAMLPQTGSSVVAAKFNDDGRRVATIAQDGAISVWDTNDGMPVVELDSRLEETRDIVFSPNNRLIATLSWSGRLALWNIATGRKLADLNHGGEPRAALAFAQNGSSVAAIAKNGSLASWPVFETVDLAVEHAMKNAGACLTPLEREERQLGKQPATWCRQQSGSFESPVEPSSSN